MNVMVGAAGLLLSLAACSRGASPGTAAPATASPAARPDFRPTASIQEIMRAEVEPSSDVLWHAVSSSDSGKGEEMRQPHTDEEWQAVRNSAITLLEATNLILMQGRQVARTGHIQDEGAPGNLSPQQIQASIDSSRGEFVSHAHALHDTVVKALTAIDAHNASDLVEAGGPIEQACENCHLRFWYPKTGT